MDGMERDFDKNSMQEFSIQFLGSKVRIDSTILPVGQVSTEILNLPEDARRELHEAHSHTADFLTGRFVSHNTKKDDMLARELQEHVNRVQDILFQVPPYSYMQTDRELARSVWIRGYEESPEEFQEVFMSGSPQNMAFRNYINSIMDAWPEIVEFRAKIHAMLEVYFEPLKSRNASEYARAAHEYIEAGRMLDDIDDLFRDRSVFKLQQTRRAMVEYVPMANPDAPEEYLIAERMVFHSIAEFLHMDLFRALINGNVPRCCHNCGRYFLLTQGYDICYCNNIAPGETDRTCRKVGAHKREAKKRGESPISAEYQRVYKKLTARKNRGKITADEWNEAVAKALAYKDRAERGELTEQMLREIYSAL